MAQIATLRSLLPTIAGFLLLMLIGASGMFVSNVQADASRWVRHTLEVERRLDTIQLLITEAETGQRGFLITGREAYLAPHAAAVSRIWGEVAQIEKDTADNALQQQAMPDLRTALTARLDKLDQGIRLRSQGDFAGAVAIVSDDSGRRLMESVRTIIARMRTEEQRLLAERSTRAEQILWAGQVVLAVSLALTAILAVLTVAGSRRRIIALQQANDELVREAGERKAAEAKVHQLVKMEAVGQLTGGIAHDFNNMLAIVIGSISMARRRLTGQEHPQIVKSLDAASEGARRGAELTSRLLAFSRKAPLAPQVVDLNTLVKGISELLRRTLGENCQIETVLSGGLWRSNADPVQIESSLVNLAVNARDAMPDGGKLTIETANAELDERYARAHAEVTAGQYVVLSVSDTGTGMTPDTLEKVFEPFFTTKPVGKGTGLGLSQVFGFVKQSGGHIKIYSEVGAGTTVKIYLPRFVGAGEIAEAHAPVAEPAAGRVEEVILVVEDDPEVREISVSLLRELGYTVLHCSSPLDALRRLDELPTVSLLFTDIVMPDMTGRQLADKAHEKRPDLKVLYTTGYTRNAVVHNGVLDPGTQFLAKPFTLEALAAKVRDVLDGSGK